MTRTRKAQLIREIEGGLREAENMNLDFYLLAITAYYTYRKERFKLIQDRCGFEFNWINWQTKLLYARLVLEDPKYAEPVIMSGVLYGIEKKPNVKWTKFEHAMAHFEYKDEKIFQSSDAIDYEDAYMTLKGQLRTTNLFDINNSEDIRTVIVDPETEYDQLLMSGWDRYDARQRIADQVDAVLSKWQETNVRHAQKENSEG